ncbi:probable beta-1,4-xylosyltransferase IRX9H isoform X2 [Nymphaea colorata]|uniref:probable beta-1,4-xylosyltransferase IRX9H isoform X2 n=1 Tax=Nymphaea colorata TaxID=210225 RepID=UPI00129E2322|nr:probable beta-1,4-xylosyltransferase IRX9H isoform X2 [Nymphaea colorata]
MPIERILAAVVSMIFNFVMGFCLQRGRSLESAKSRAHGWKRAFLHFSLCFIFGLLIGLTPTITLDFLPNLDLGHRKLPTGLNRESKGFAGSRNQSIESLFLNAIAGREPRLRKETGNGTTENFTTSARVDELQKLLIVASPTYSRSFQAYYLNRLAHTLRLVPPPLLWIVVETSLQTAETARLLRRTGVMYRHLVSDKNFTSVRDRGIHQRNVALAHIEKHRLDGIVYFADDDNEYSKDLFQYIRNIRRFGTWPVATLVKTESWPLIEGPVCNGSQVIGWHTSLKNKSVRRFPIDMSAFAFNSTVLWDPKRWQRHAVQPIWQQDTVKELTALIDRVVEDESQMEGIPPGCSRVLVWKLHMEAPALSSPNGLVVQK